MRTEVPELLTVEDVAQRFKLTKGAIYQMIARKEISYIKMGRRIRFVSNSLSEWLESQKVEGNNGNG